MVRISAAIKILFAAAETGMLYYAIMYDQIIVIWMFGLNFLLMWWKPYINWFVYSFLMGLDTQYSQPNMNFGMIFDIIYAFS